MAQSLAKLYVHLIFSTKGRQRWLAPEIRDELHAYLVGILCNLDSPSILLNSVDDHVHVLFCLSRNHAIKTVVEKIKASSSKWVKDKWPSLRSLYWQNGYGAFSVSQSNVGSTKRYIAQQEEHHRKMSFQEEFRRFLERYQVEYDERYVWD